PAGDYVLVVLTRHPYNPPPALYAIRRISALAYDAYAGDDRPGLNAETPEPEVAGLGLVNPLGAPAEPLAGAAMDEATDSEAAEPTPDAQAPVLAAALPSRPSEVVLSPVEQTNSPVD